MRGFLAVQGVPIAMYEGLFGSGELSPLPYMRGFLAVQSVPIAIYEGLFGSAKCLDRHI